MVPYLIYRTFGFSDVGPDVMVAAQAYVSMVSAFVPLPGASGGAEGSFLLFFGPFFPTGTLLPATVLWRMLTYYMSLPMGALCTWISGHLKPLPKAEPIKTE